VITIAVSGPQSLDQITRVAKDQIQRALEGVPGVQSVSLSGGQTREIQIKVDPRKLEAYGIGLNTVQLALQSDQIQTPAGLLTVDGTDVNVRLNGLVSQPQQLGRIIVATTPAGPVYLHDVATVADGFKTIQTINRVNGGLAVTITATKGAGANTLAVSRGVRRAMDQLQPTLPQGMRLYVVNDAATYTQQSFNTIQQTLLEAVLLTGLILLVFLHTWRSTLIVLVAIPSSLLTTFGLMRLLGMDLNLFSMLAVTLSVGILVDDSIVVLENIYRHLGLDEPPVLAAINGRSEIGLAALTITMVDVAVYVPIALIPGIAGEFIRPFAVVIAAATLTSLVVSFTLTPLLASRLSQPEDVR
jgi:HAE1 family hydrophobic/amphiphilic exporter-1